MGIGGRDPDAFLPLRAVEFQIVLSLSEGDKHGYAIIQDARDRGEGAAVPGLATLYRALRRLESEGLVERPGGGGDLAEERRRGLAFADEVSRLIWSGTERWDQSDHLAEAAGRAGLDLAELDKVAEAEVDRLERGIEKNQADHATAGHWGVPTCVFRGEPFFGQDRLDVLLWRLKQSGLKER